MRRGRPNQFNQIVTSGLQSLGVFASFRGKTSSQTEKLVLLPKSDSLSVLKLEYLAVCYRNSNFTSSQLRQWGAPASHIQQRRFSRHNNPSGVPVESFFFSSCWWLLKSIFFSWILKDSREKNARRERNVLAAAQLPQPVREMCGNVFRSTFRATKSENIDETLENVYHERFMQYSAQK